MRRALLLICLLASGCAKPLPAPRSEAALVAQAYYDALLRRDWPAAYAKLDPDAQGRWKPDGFAKAAQQFRNQMGVEPACAHMGACEEHGDEAIAHVLLIGHTAGKRHTIKDAVRLRRSDSGWGIVPPPRFGQSAAR